MLMPWNVLARIVYFKSQFIGKYIHVELENIDFLFVIKSKFNGRRNLVV